MPKTPRPIKLKAEQMARRPEGLPGLVTIACCCHFERSASKIRPPGESGAHSREIPKEHPWPYRLREFFPGSFPQERGSERVGLLPLETPHPLQEIGRAVR